MRKGDGRATCLKLLKCICDTDNRAVFISVAEPGCAVKAAVESQQIDRKRFESYLKLRTEREAARKPRRG